MMKEVHWVNLIFLESISQAFRLWHLILILYSSFPLKIPFRKNEINILASGHHLVIGLFICQKVRFEANNLAIVVMQDSDCIISTVDQDEHVVGNDFLFCRCPLKTLQKCEIALEKLKNDMAVVNGGVHFPLCRC